MAVEIQVQFRTGSHINHQVISIVLMFQINSVTKFILLDFPLDFRGERTEVMTELYVLSGRLSVLLAKLLHL